MSSQQWLKMLNPNMTGLGGGPLGWVTGFLRAWSHHSRMVTALMMREISTRFGRDGLGFAWLILEPLAFCVGVLVLWSLTKPAYEHGIKLQAFVMTGYMCLILIRHQISYSVAAINSNIGLLHHRQIKPIHIFLSRNLLEIGGATTAFIVVYVALLSLRVVDLPRDYFLVYCGWLLLAWLGFGFAMFMAGLAMMFDVIERIIPVLTYILIPLSGAFFMVAWMPPKVREVYLLLPFPHPIEMLRAGVFGEFVETHYDVVYPLAWGAVFLITGLLLMAASRDKIDVE